MAPMRAVEAEIMAVLRRINHEVDMQSRRLQEEHGITGPQLAVLRAISEEGSSVSELAAAVSLSGPTVTGILDRLERKRVVARRIDPSDRRKVRIVLSEKGRQLLEQAPSLMREEFRKRLGELKDWERTSILAALQRVAWLMGVTPRLDGDDPSRAQSMRRDEGSR